MKPDRINLLIGLGNPGSKYKDTRHNIGFMVLQKLAESQGVNFYQNKKINGEIAELGHGKDKQRLLLPRTFMNESGRSIKSAINWFSLTSKQILVLVDDMDLPLGKIRLRQYGGSGGHNGLKSTIQHLGTQDFSRLRIGIGSPAITISERKEKTISHVLGNFDNKESLIIEKVIKEVIKELKLMNTLGLEKSINNLNSFRPDNQNEYSELDAQ